MALPRKSAQQVAARELARERASGILAQQERLIDLAVDFNLEQVEVNGLAARKLERIQAIEEEYESELVARSARLGQIIADMAAQGEKLPVIATRLGQKLVDVKRWSALAVTATKATATDKVEGQSASTPVGDEASVVDNQEQLVA